MNKSSVKWYIIGMLPVAMAFNVGYFARGSEVENNAKLEQLAAIQTSLSSIASKLPPQKIVEVEKVVQAPFCEFALQEHLNKTVRDSLPAMPVKDLEICKRLMRFHSPFVKADNTYEAIGEWVKSSNANPSVLEDEIMATVLSTLVYCFKNT